MEVLVMSSFIKSVLYREVSSKKCFAVLFYRTENENGCLRVNISFVETPNFVKELSQKGVQIMQFLGANSVDVFLKKNGCEFIKRLPISPDSDIFEALEITSSCLRIFKLFNS